MKKTSLVLVAAVLFLCIAIIIYLYIASVTTVPAEKYATYFSYTPEEFATLQGLSSRQEIGTLTVYQWDQIAFDLMSKNTTKETFTEEPSKVYAYLAMAQREFYVLSFQTSGKNAGTFDYLSKDVLCLFFENDCASIVTYSEKDLYSEAISKLILKKIQERRAEDAAGLKPYILKEGQQYWSGTGAPLVGPTNGHSLGWFIDSGSQFRAVPPPEVGSDELNQQLRTTQNARRASTKEQREAVVSWAGVPGTKTPPGQLLDLGDTYMMEHQVPIGKMLHVRSVLALAVADATTSVFDSKYTYQLKRPFMLDSELITIMPTPNHPSYPSGHSTLSKAATTVLAFYFPEDAQYWNEKATEAGMSRVWGGIHFMIDHESGAKMGEQVGILATQKSEEL